MPSPCPQCGTLRARKISICKNCGYDPAAAEAATAAAAETAAPAPEAAPPPTWIPPTACPRCGAPVNPGNAFCANCGLTLPTPWGPPARRVDRRLLAIGGVAVVAVVALVGILALANRSNGWDPSGEPSPSGTWQSFTSPDGTWSAAFPGYAAPQHMTQTMEMGSSTVAISLYAGLDGDAAYEVAAMDVPSQAMSGSSDEILDNMEQNLLMVPGGTITASRDLTVGPYQAREVKFTGVSTMKLEGYARFWLAGDRVYMLMVFAEPGTVIYPQHFFESFQTK
jgi:hypothetical protein